MISSEWFSESGPNSPALKPLNSGVVKTLPLSHVSVVEGALPAEPEEIRAVNHSYMEVIGAISVAKWGMVLGAIFAVPGTIASVAGLVFMAFISPEMWGLIVLMTVVNFFGVSMAASFFCLAMYSPADEPIRFDRVRGTLFRYRAKKWRFLGMDAPMPGGSVEIVTHAWSDVRAEVVRKLLFTGKTARMDCFLEFAIVDPQTQLVSERFRVGDRDVFSDFTGRILLWEAIRRYMEEGPEQVPVPKCKVSDGGFIDSIEEFNPVSIPLLFPAGASRFFGGIMGFLLWLVTPLNVLFALCNWIGVKTAKAVDWGELENTVFKVSPDDEFAKAQLEKQRALHSSPQWAAELKRRRLSAVVWLGLIVVWWLILAWLIKLPPFRPAHEWRQVHEAVGPAVAVQAMPVTARPPALDVQNTRS